MAKRLGTFGAGGHGFRSHFTVSDEVEIVAVFDPEPGGRTAARQKLGSNVAVYATEHELLAHPLDGIVIMSPDEFHADQLALAVRAGLPVLCEKPLAIDNRTLHVALQALEDAEASNLLVASCHPRRHLDAQLAYGWVRSALASLSEQFGPLLRIGLTSIYPQPKKLRKTDRSFLLDKFVHDIDYLRQLFGDTPFRAQRLADSHDHYEVIGSLFTPGGDVSFACQGTRLHTGEDEFIEIITLTFQRGEVLVYPKTGEVRVRNRLTGAKETIRIDPMDSAGYDRVFAGIMRDFAAAIDGGARTHTYDDLRVNALASVGLTNNYGTWSYMREPAE